MPDSALKTCDVMRMLNIRSADTLYAMVARGEISAVRVGREYRFFPEALEAFRRGETVAKVRERRKRRSAASPWGNVPQRIK